VVQFQSLCPASWIVHCCSLHSRDAQLEYGLLLYFAGQIEEAWQELAVLRETMLCANTSSKEVDGGHELDVLLEKLRLLMEQRDWQ
jgi:hypothetical protein